MSKSPAADVIDAAFELAVVPSFSRIGPALRSRLYDWPVMPDRSLAGKTALVTGATSGIGRAAVSRLAQAGARVVLLGRSAAKLESLKSELISLANEDRFPLVIADMSSLASVRAAVEEIAAREDRLDVLVDNAGAIYPERIENDDGIEKTLAILVCGPFALVSGLLPLLRRSGGARVIAVTSGGMYTQPVDLDDLEWRDRPYNGARAYAQAKRIQVALVREWARRYPGAGVSFNAMHPGWADTPGLADSLPGFYRAMKPLLRTPEQGADTIAWLATTPTLPAPGGRLYLDRRPRPFDRAPQTRLDADDRAELWDLITKLTRR
jgi:dehydrogenase/reductase SDR family member 12